MSPLEKRRLGRSGVELSAVGLGTVQMGYSPHIDYEQAAAIVQSAYEVGIRYFDTAPMYGTGRAEYTLGRAIRELNVRKEVVVSSKVGRVLDTADVPAAQRPADSRWFLHNPHYQYDYTYDGFMRSVEHSLERSGLDRIDVLLVHDLGRAWHGLQADQYWKQIREGGYRALDELRSTGVVSAVGLGVNETDVVVEVAREFAIDCAMIAGRYTLLNHEPLNGHFDELQRREVAVIAAGAFNSGVLALGACPSAMFDYRAVPADIAARVAIIQSVCASYGVAMSAAALQFSACHPAVRSLVFGAQSVEEVEQNVAAFSTLIPAQFWAQLKEQHLIPEHAPVPGEEPMR
ncbi:MULTISPECIES: aldo/keto reductase [unclassified Pseudomonas]|uniref:aldo/keto reductase n=1 Tax=unclassified Pseudomonas TaxID=196821 RepID=UPI000C86AE7C|nr:MULTISPECIES: aldo/keto reductase [unclassified Pseudomonas]PMV22717.1 aldo/keto reductase [Pseudomonas sp. FW305-3-2-15-C-TSA2]PMV29380.1 aldo/keto reductase [Pseudomonas sp. DP16D-L5]PMV39283.1 aldo/keto reductase [Pseudomonas sp. FW305-3-2-15-A-LB2]PMV45593.1 aldo/keto reductase [Pseudomonas sp. FW305-3-2-15-C-R2A1]PMV51964.1 aldo/keto reductase [Pseudomonas sp. FW305-3-2-15-C-LB1]